MATPNESWVDTTEYDGDKTTYGDYDSRYRHPEPVVAPVWDGPGRDPSSKTYASDTWADITRGQWEDYVSRFIPKEDELLNMTTYHNPGLVDSSIAKGTQSAAIGFNTARNMADQYQSRYGAALSRGEQQYQDRASGVGRSAAIVHEANRIRQRLQDRNREIAIGGSNAAIAASSKQ